MEEEEEEMAHEAHDNCAWRYVKIIEGRVWSWRRMSMMIFSIDNDDVEIK